MHGEPGATIFSCAPACTPRSAMRATQVGSPTTSATSACSSHFRHSRGSMAGGTATETQSHLDLQNIYLFVYGQASFVGILPIRHQKLKPSHRLVCRECRLFALN